ncbi:MAG: hypothetical protein AAF649_08005 [Verrucomicrobiota bacterium]
MLVQSSCSTIENSFEAKDSNREDYNRGDGADRGGAQFETAIWSSDPNRKTLPKALGADGKEK